MKLSALRVDPKVIEGGRWVADIPGMPGVRLKVRGMGSAAFRSAYSRLSDAVPRSKRVNGRFTPEATEELHSRALLEAVLLDWSGLEDEDGGPLPFSREVAEPLLLDPAYREFRGAVAWAANVVDQDRSDNLQEDVGNS